MDRNNKEILKFSFKQSTSPVAYCALTIKKGTRDEDPMYNGLAHFTEHMLFKGTKKRSANSINNLLERVGGELNAYTTKEETVLHATVLKEDIKKAVDLLFEIAFTSIFPQKEIEKEREVILDEIISYKDLPAEAIYDNFEQLLFKGHPLEMQILGEKKTLKNINSSVFLNYLATSFLPDNMAFTLIADLSESKVKDLVKKSAKKFLNRDIELSSIVSKENTKGNFSEELTIGEKFIKVVEKKNHQAHCIMGASAYSCMNEKRIPLVLLVNMLGGPASSSKLNMILREKNGLVYNVEANYTPYEDTGIFTIYFGCDKTDVDKCIALIKRELNKFLKNPLSLNLLKKAKKQLLGQLSISQDNSEAQCLSMGKSLAVYGQVSSFEKICSKVEAITPDDIQIVAKEILNWERLSILIYK